MPRHEVPQPPLAHAVGMVVAQPRPQRVEVEHQRRVRRVIVRMDRIVPRAFGQILLPAERHELDGPQGLSLSAHPCQLQHRHHPAPIILGAHSQRHGVMVPAQHQRRQPPRPRQRRDDVLRARLERLHLQIQPHPPHAAPHKVPRAHVGDGGGGDGQQVYPAGDQPAGHVPVEGEAIIHVQQGRQPGVAQPLHALHRCVRRAEQQPHLPPQVPALGVLGLGRLQVHEFRLEFPVGRGRLCVRLNRRLPPASALLHFELRLLATPRDAGELLDRGLQPQLPELAGQVFGPGDLRGRPGQPRANVPAQVCQVSFEVGGRDRWLGHVRTLLNGCGAPAQFVPSRSPTSRPEGATQLT